MANIKSAKKRIRQNATRQEHNKIYRGGARTFVKKARLAIEAGDIEKAREATRLAASALDKAASKGSIHKNNAGRRKGAIMGQLAALEQGKTQPKAAAKSSTKSKAKAKTKAKTKAKSK